jgi:hypothetical protein
MAHLLYSNGITEEFNPKNLTFTEEELVNLFTEFAEIKSERMIVILNTWGIYGVNSNNDPADFNKIASDMLNIPIYSRVLFVHDSELNIEWNVSDNILYKNYKEHSIEIIKLIEETATDIVNELEASQQYEEKIDHLPQLVTIGATPDKRVLFGFNPNEQTSEFYNHDEFYTFSQKVYNYIIHNKQVKEPFTIYADKKAVIIIDPKYVISFLNTMLEKFKSKEEYEICTDISNIIKTWSLKISTKKTRKRKSSGENKP